MWQEAWLFYEKIRYKNRNILEINDLRAFHEEQGNELATVLNSAICGVFRYTTRICCKVKEKSGNRETLCI